MNAFASLSRGESEADTGEQYQRWWGGESGVTLDWEETEEENWEQLANHCGTLNTYFAILSF